MTEKSRITTRENYDHFSGVLDSQSAADTLLAPFSAMNQCQRVLFFKRELRRLLHESKMFI